MSLEYHISDTFQTFILRWSAHLCLMCELQSLDVVIGFVYTSDHDIFHQIFFKNTNFTWEILICQICYKFFLVTSSSWLDTAVEIVSLHHDMFLESKVIFIFLDDNFEFNSINFRIELIENSHVRFFNKMWKHFEILKEFRNAPFWKSLEMRH